MSGQGNQQTVTVVGAGLAGCEAAWQIAESGFPVRLVEMKPGERSPAHAQDGMAELVCSNSFRGASLSSAVGLLKEELKQLDSLIMAMALKSQVPAGRALAVDRHLFSSAVETAITGHPNIEVVRERLDDLPSDRVIVATGPLTGGRLMASLEEKGALLHYHDAIAPLVSAESLDMDCIFAASRYDDAQTPDEEKGAYLNCPMDQQTYYRFVEELVLGERTPLKDFEKAPFFEGCLPVEEMAVRGPLTLAHGPLKPVGLTDPRTGSRPFAVVQLRREDNAGQAFNLVGFQTRLTRPEQRRIFRMIPGLETVRFIRYGQVHRNSFVNAPAVLDPHLRLRENPRISIAGQLSGVEGYVESVACGWAAGYYAVRELRGQSIEVPPPSTALGGLLRYLTIPKQNFQPSNVLWLMIDTPQRGRRVSKKRHRELSAEKALLDILSWRNRNSQQ